MEQLNCLEESTECENPISRGTNFQEVKIPEKKGNLEESQPTDETKDDVEARNDFWSMEGDFIYRHDVEPRVQQKVANEETFPNCTEIHGSDQDCADKIWMCCEKAVLTIFGMSMSDSWTGFTKFILLKEKPPKGFLWSGERLTKIQATTRSDSLWPEISSGMSRAAQEKEKHEWAIEKPKLKNARGPRGIYFVDPDGEYKETILKRKDQVGDADGGGYALQNVNKEAF